LEASGGGDLSSEQGKPVAAVQTRMELFYRLEFRFFIIVFIRALFATTTIVTTPSTATEKLVGIFTKSPRVASTCIKQQW
jgi:hypothetical protein